MIFQRETSVSDSFSISYLPCLYVAVWYHSHHWI